MEQPLIGRAREREALAACVAAGRGVAVLEGEPGIGKSRLLAWVASTASGSTVLAARASEYEADLPYALWADALGEVVGEADRHATHRALRSALEELASVRPVVVCLDDVHWADPASVDALAALVHRPPAGDVLLVLAARTGQLPLALGAVAPIRVGPLSAEEAVELVGAEAAAVYADSGGNPFYLEQLVRSGGAAGAGARGDGTVPPAVAAALAAELGGLGADARRLLDAAAVVGDPFELDLAAAVAELDVPAVARGGSAARRAAGRGEPEAAPAETSEPGHPAPAGPGVAALAAVDDLLARSLVRPGGAPRNFAFRHPVVRHAVYEAAPGWLAPRRACPGGRRARAARRGAGRAGASRGAGGSAGRRGGDRAADRRGG